MKLSFKATLVAGPLIERSGGISSEGTAMDRHYCSKCERMTEHRTVGEIGEWRSDPAIPIPSATAEMPVWAVERVFICGECGIENSTRAVMPAEAEPPVP